MTTQNESLKNIKSTLADLKQSKIAIEQRIKANEEKREALLNMPVRLDDFESTVQIAVENMGKKFSTTEMTRLTQSNDSIIRSAKKLPFSQSFCLKDIEMYENTDKDTILWMLGLTDRHINTTPSLTFSLLCRLMPEQVTQEIISAIHHSTGGKWGNEGLSTIEERRQLISEYDIRLIDLQKEKSAIINQIEEITTSIQSVLS